MRTSSQIAAALAFGLVALAAGDDGAQEAAAQEVYIDYDRSVSLTRLKTFAVAEPKGDESLAESSPVTHRHLVGAIRKRLLAAGRLTEDTEDPDVYVTYRVATKEGMSLDTESYEPGSGWRPGYYWAGGGWGMASATASAYGPGTLVIDAWTAKEKRLVWRGLATETVVASAKGNKLIDGALDKLMKKWEGMRAEGK